MKKAAKDIRQFFKPAPKTSLAARDDNMDSCSELPSIISPSSLPSSEGPSKPVEVYQRVSESSTSVCDLGTLETGPKQPMLEAYPKTHDGRQLRGFSAKYFSTHQWLEYSVSKDAVFCYSCRIFSVDSDVREQREKFITSGFNKWKKLSEALTTHEGSSLQKKCKEKFLAHKMASSSVADQVILQNQLQEEGTMAYISKLFDIVLYLGKQGLSFRGHREGEDSTNKGNYLELCDLFGSYDSSFQKHLSQKISYTSPLLQNDMISSVATVMRREISQIQNAGMFSIIVDEARCFKQEQMSIVVRYTENNQPRERFIRFVDCSEARDATSLANEIIRELKSLNVYGLLLVAQSYDGASVMQGKHNGVQMKIKEHFPKAEHVHCMAHRINLVIVDACKAIPKAATFFNVIESIYIHFNKPSCHSKYVQVQKMLGLKQKEVGSLSTTRWNCRYKNCRCLIENYEAITETLSEEGRHGKDKDAITAIGILASISKPEFVVSLFTMEYVLSLINVLSNYFHKPDATLGGSATIVTASLDTLKEKRNKFNDVWSAMEKFATENDLFLEAPRASKKRKPIRNTALKDFVEDGTVVGQEVDVADDGMADKDYWRTKIYEAAIDAVITAMEKRFNNLDLVKSIDCFQLLDVDGGRLFIETYRDEAGIDVTELGAEVQVYRSYLRKLKTESEWDAEFVRKNVDATLMPNLSKGLNLAITIPVGSATAERSFSAMGRIKTWLRSTMEQDRFSSLSLLHIEENLLKEIKKEKVIEQFASKSRRLNF